MMIRALTKIIFSLVAFFSVSVFCLTQNNKIARVQKLVLEQAGIKNIPAGSLRSLINGLHLQFLFP